MTHPVSPQDGVLLVELCWLQLVLDPQRWQLLLRLPLLVLPVLFQLGPSTGPQSLGGG